MGAQKNCLNEMILLSTSKHISKLKDMEILKKMLIQDVDKIVWKSMPIRIYKGFKKGYRVYNIGHKQDT